MFVYIRKRQEEIRQGYTNYLLRKTTIAENVEQ